MLTDQDLKKIQQLTKELLSTELEPIKKDLKYLKRKTSRIERDQKMMLDVLNQDDVQLHHRVKRIEDYLGFN